MTPGDDDTFLGSCEDIVAHGHIGRVLHPYADSDAGRNRRVGNHRCPSIVWQPHALFASTQASATHRAVVGADEKDTVIGGYTNIQLLDRRMLRCEVYACAKSGNAAVGDIRIDCRGIHVDTSLAPAPPVIVWPWRSSETPSAVISK